MFYYWPWHYKSEQCHLVEGLILRGAGLCLVCLPHHRRQVGGSGGVRPRQVVGIAGRQGGVVPAFIASLLPLLVLGSLLLSGFVF